MSVIPPGQRSQPVTDETIEVEQKSESGPAPTADSEPELDTIELGVAAEPPDETDSNAADNPEPPGKAPPLIRNLCLLWSQSAFQVITNNLLHLNFPAQTLDHECNVPFEHASRLLACSIRSLGIHFCIAFSPCSMGSVLHLPLLFNLMRPL